MIRGYAGLPRAIDKFPPALDPVWEMWSVAVLVFLQEPRTWTAIRIWAKEQRISMDRMRNILAWLSLQEKADTLHLRAGKRGSLAWLATLSRSCGGTVLEAELEEVA